MTIMKPFQHLSRLFFLAVSLAAQLPANAQSGSPENSGIEASQRPSVPAPSERLNFHTDLFTGRFGYQIPVPVAPARHGSAPQLALAYNSSGENGWCGVGWSLDLGYIQRETKHGVPVAWSNGSAQAAYDDGKGFVFFLNGHSADLVSVGNSEYRAEIEGGFLRFVLQTGANQWVVTDPSGNTYYFGETSASRMSNSKSGWPSSAWNGTFRWCLSHVQTVLGDTAHYTYSNIGGMLYPTQISYNGHTSGVSETHTVNFYLSTRSDVRLSFLSGYRVEYNQKLDAIVSKVGSMVVWSNRLGYTASPSTQRLLLSSSTLWGTNLTTSWPTISFGYSTQNFGFQPLTYWTNLSIPTGGYPNYYQISMSQGSLQFLDLIDMDGDGLPDRVFEPVSAPYTNLWVQHNNGSGFDNPVAFGPLSVQIFNDGVQNLSSSNNVDWSGINGAYMRLVDINNDGLADRVMDPIQYYSQASGYPYTNQIVQFNNSSNLDSTASWTNVVGKTYMTGDPQTNYYTSVEQASTVLMLDMNGDGLPDRVMIKKAAPYNCYLVQFNTGSGYTGTNAFTFDTSYGNPTQPAYYGGTLSDLYLRLVDLNGDGLPDRVLLQTNSTGTADLTTCGQDWIVEFNNGYGFEPPTHWTGLAGQYLQGGACPANHYCPETDPASAAISLQDCDEHVLRDINGDGLPDFIYRYRDCSITNLMVQINLGTNFASPQLYGPYYSQGDVNDLSGLQGANTHFVDINGDGIPDHVMFGGTTLGTTNAYGVELSKGPIPDLMLSVSNGIGGSVALSYKASNKYDNRESTTSSNARRLLPFLMQTVSSMAVSDGIYPAVTNTYSYQGGMWSAPRREFHGFATVTETDPLGMTNVHWFHQAGGRDNSSVGEYQDNTNNIGKNGIEFRTDVYGSDGNLYKTVLNEVQDASLGNGRHFGYVNQTITLDYADASDYKATAQQFTFNVNTGNLLGQTNFGQVNSVVAAGQSFSDPSSADNAYHTVTYATLANTNILNKPSRTALTSDAAGANILRETLDAYDGQTGNMTQERRRICDTPGYVTNSLTYDSFNNPHITTDEAGIVTTLTYDSTYQTYPAQSVTATFTTTTQYDPRTGKILSSTDPKGLVSAYKYDALLRLAEKDVSTTPNGAASLWLTTYQYGLGMAGGYSTNYLVVRKNDDVNANGFENWTYFDGLERVLQVRVESESSGSYRVTDTVYDKREEVQFVTLPYFSSGSSFTKPTGTELGTLHVYDPVGRIITLSNAVNGTFTGGLLTGTPPASPDSGSPVGPSSIAYKDGTDPWTLVLTDEAGKVRKFSLDPYGRTNKVVEVVGGNNFTTLLSYNLAGDLTNVTDNASNQIQYAYNRLGQLVAMADPDMGVWQYERDYAGRLRLQVDANGQSVRYSYNDPLGRLASRQVYDFSGGFAYGDTNVYDSSDDGNFTIYAGQLYKTIDSEGWQKNGYDLRGRTVKTARYLNKNGNTYTNQLSYDDLDRVTQTVYPNGGPTVQNVYDIGANLSQVKQIGGSATVFYTAQGFNAIGQLTGINFGNGVATTFSYYANSKRLYQLVTSGNIQNLTYTYDQASNIKSIADGGGYSGTASASVNNISYDDLHRLTSLTRPAISQTVNFGYDSIGNVTTNSENGGPYTYGIRIPHAVKTANGLNYAYDANGNMLVRGNERLSYDPENRLSYTATAASVTTFGYDAGGARLWKSSTNGLQVWIDGNYEEKNGAILYHILANGQPVCTFDKYLTNIFAYYHSDQLHSTAIETAQNGSLAEHYEYSAFGQSRYTLNSAAFPVTRRFTSQSLDDETGLYYYGSANGPYGRYYDPRLGRFVQPDDVIPDLSRPQSFDRYAYCRNNPLKNTDPSGHIDQKELDDLASRAGQIHGIEGINYAEVANKLRIPGYEIQRGMSGEGDVVSAAARGAGPAADAYTSFAGDIGTVGLATAPLVFSRIGRTIEKEGAETLSRGATRVASEAGTVVRAAKIDYRAVFFAAHPELEGKVIVHHAIEQQVLKEFPGVMTEAEIHSLENLRGIPKSINSDVHLSQIRIEWNRFYEPFRKAGTAPSKSQLLQKASEIDRKYGSMFVPPVGGAQ
jgi:RHS repeat-associated protein